MYTYSSNRKLISVSELMYCVRVDVRVRLRRFAIYGFEHSISIWCVSGVCVCAHVYPRKLNWNSQVNPARQTDTITGQ